MKKHCISMLAFLMALATSSFAQDAVIDEVVENGVNEVVEEVVDSAAAQVETALKDSSASVETKVEKIKTAVEPVAAPVAEVDSVATDTTETDSAEVYVPYVHGLLLRPELGGGLMTNSNIIGDRNFDFSVGVNLAYQFTTRFSIGWGVSFFMNTMKLDNFDEIMAWSLEEREEYKDMNYILPIYLMGRFKFTEKKVAPFLDIRLGYAVGLSKYKLKIASYDPGINTDNSGLFLEFQGGVQIKNFSVGLVLNRLGCKDLDPDYRAFLGWGNSNYHNVFVGLKVGYDFNLGTGIEEEEPEPEMIKGVAEDE